MPHNIVKGVDCLEVELPCGSICLIDHDDVGLLYEFPNWRAHKRGGEMGASAVQITRFIKTKYGVVREDRYLHRVIMHEAPKNPRDVIDHIDRNPLNNRKDNLRWVSQSCNTRNTPRMAKGTSVYRGVHLIVGSKKNPWRATIKSPDGSRKHLGLFKTEASAAIAYNEASKLWYGGYGWQNELKS